MNNEVPVSSAVRCWCAAGLIGTVLLAAAAQAGPAEHWTLYVSNERSGDLTVIDGSDLKVLATLPVGKRPRGIHSSPDGKTVYVALSGTAIEPPPQLDAQGNPIFARKADHHDDDDEADNADKSADAIGVIDVAQQKLTGKINVGSDPEEFALSKDARQLYVSNEDTKTASVIDIASGKIQHIILTAQEPEGVATTPDGKSFFVTCEAGGDVFVIDSTTYMTSAHFKVDVRPRSVAFLPSGAVAFIPSESVGELNVVDTATGGLLKTVALPSGSRPMKVVVAPDGNKVYVSNGRSGTVAVLDSHSYELLDSIKVGTRPWGLAISPDGKFLYTANGPSNDISVVDLGSNKEITRVRAGGSPWGITVVPGSARAR